MTRRFEPCRGHHASHRCRRNAVTGDIEVTRIGQKHKERRRSQQAAHLTNRKWIAKKNSEQTREACPESSADDKSKREGALRLLVEYKRSSTGEQQSPKLPVAGSTPAACAIVDRTLIIGPHSICSSGSMAEHLRAMEEMRVRLPTTAPTKTRNAMRKARAAR